MKSYQILGFSTLLISLSIVTPVTVDTTLAKIHNSKDVVYKTDILTDVHIYCSKPTNNCNDTKLLNPLIDLLMRQTKTGLAGYEYQDHFVKLIERFARQISLEDIISEFIEFQALYQLFGNLKNYANEEFAGTEIQTQMFETYREFQKRVMPEQIISLIIGESTGPLLETYLASIHVGFEGHPEVQNVLDQFVNLQCSYNKGRTTISKELRRILLTDNSVLSTERDECLESEKYFNYTSDGKGCPTGFTLNAGICYKVIAKPTLTYDEARAMPNNPYRSRLAKIRNQGGWKFLTSLMTGAGATHMWVGLRDVRVAYKGPHNWQWEDGSSQVIPGHLPWHAPQPDYFPEDCLIMTPPSYCWSDYRCYHLSQKQSVMQVTATRGQCPPKFNLYDKTQTCYSAEAVHGGTPAVLKTSDQWQFVIDLIKKSPNNGMLFVIGGAGGNGKWQSDDFGQWCPGEPDNQVESCGEMVNWAGSIKMNDLQCYAKISHAREWIASSCSEWYYLGHKTSGLYRILPLGAKVDIEVYCDMVNKGGGWTVIQSRKGPTSFERSISEYTKGFGSVNGDFWLGLEAISQLTSQEVSLLITLKDKSGQQHTIKYPEFRLIKSGSSYKFRISNFKTASRNDLATEFSMQQDVPFSIEPQKGGWWFSTSSAVNLNGIFPTGQPGHDTDTLMQWSSNLIVTETEMKVKSSYFCKCF